MSSIQTRSKAVANNIALVKSNWPLPKEAKDRMTEIKEVMHEATEKVATIIGGTEHDECKLEEYTAKMVFAKDIACQALVLPHKSSN
jgi:hypothetical protein